MKKRFIIFLVVAIGLKSCFLADNFFEEDSYVLPLDIVVKDSVQAYLKRNIDANQSYLNYGFGDLKIKVPAALQAYNKWDNRVGDANYIQKTVKDSLKVYEEIVKTNNLKRTLAIDHEFSIRSVADTIGEVSSITFLLNENIEVKDFDPIYTINVNDREEEVYANFYYESPLIKGYTYEQSKKLTNDFYRFYKNHLDSLESSAERSSFLKHTISICDAVLLTKKFNDQEITENLAKQYLRQKKSDVIDYKSVNFSKLFEINEKNVLIGYYFFHTFSYKTQNGVDTMSVYIKFSPHYEIESVFETSQYYEPNNH